jgi:superkiller protein 3
MRTPRLLILLLMLSLTTVAPIAVAQTTQQLVEQANAAQATGNYAQAQAIWRQVLQREPNNADAYLGLGNSQVLLANQAWKVSEYGDVLKERKKLGDAMADSRIAALVSPTDYYSYIKLGETLTEPNNFPQMSAVKRKIVPLGTGNRKIHMIRVDIGARHYKRLNDAIATYRKATQVAPNNINAYAGLANTLYYQAKLGEVVWTGKAAADFNRYCYSGFSDDNPDNSSVERCRQIALDYQQKLDAEKQKLAEVVAAYRKVIQLDPNNASFYNALGNALYDRQQLDEAVIAYRQAIQLNPKEAEGYTLWGLVLHRQKKLDKAITAYHQAIQLSPNDAEAYNRLGNALQDLQKLDEAIAAYRKAVELAPNNPIFYSFLGSALFTDKKLDEAIAAYRKAIELEARKDQLGSLNPFLHIALGNAFQQVGGRVYLLEARQQYRRAFQIGGTGALAQDKILEVERLLSSQ